MRRVPRESESQNYDSFLDIVANLVGILVILIMVIGVRARHVVDLIPEVATVPEVIESIVPPAPIKQLQPTVVDHKKLSRLRAQISEQMLHAKKIKADSHEMNANIQEMVRMAAAQKSERNQLQMAISLAEKAIEQRQHKLGEQQQVQLAIAKQVQASRHELQQLHEQASAVEAIAKTPEVLEHHPSPIAKTVFGKEEHFRITGGRIAYVPLNEVVEMMRRDVKTKLSKLAKVDSATETVGPVEGFYGRYTIERVRGLVKTAEGMRTASSIELRELDLVPTEQTLGEPMAVAIQPKSEFFQRVSYMDPETTITMWVYPDGYGDYRKIKSLVSQRGFPTAARVLQFGYLIGGAPNGTKSAAE